MPQPRMSSLGLGLIAALGTVPATAQTAPRPPEPRVSWVADSIVTASGVGVALAAGLIPVDRSRRLSEEAFLFDRGTRLVCSSTAAEFSNALALVTLVTPVALQIGAGWSETGGKRLLIYGETLSLTWAVNSVTKYLVGRPRPYVYHPDKRVAVYADRQGADSQLSFFSGHSALTFAAAVSGSFLFTQTSPDLGARAGVWGTELFLATTTAGLRVRAGHHFPTDVLFGGVVGVGLGLGIPYAHYAGRHPRVPSTAEWVAIGVGPLLGALTSALWPLPSDVLTPLDGPLVALAPWVGRSAAGFALSGPW